MPNTIKRGCRWILQPNRFVDGEYVEGTYCDKPVKYHMFDDGSGDKVRDYDSFCPEHMNND